MGVSHHGWTEEEDCFVLGCHEELSKSPSKIRRKMLAETDFTRSIESIRDRLKLLLEEKLVAEVPFELISAADIPAVFGIGTQLMRVYGSQGKVPSVLIGRKRYYDIAMLDILVESIRGAGKSPDWEYFQQECEVLGLA